MKKREPVGSLFCFRSKRGYGFEQASVTKDLSQLVSIRSKRGYGFELEGLKGSGARLSQSAVSAAMASNIKKTTGKSSEKFPKTVSIRSKRGYGFERNVLCQIRP